MSDRERSKQAPIGWAAFPELFGPAVEYATDHQSARSGFEVAAGIHGPRLSLRSAGMTVECDG